MLLRFQPAGVDRQGICNKMISFATLDGDRKCSRAYVPDPDYLPVNGMSDVPATGIRGFPTGMLLGKVSSVFF